MTPRRRWPKSEERTSALVRMAAELSLELEPARAELEPAQRAPRLPGRDPCAFRRGDGDLTCASRRWRYGAWQTEPGEGRRSWSSGPSHGPRGAFQQSVTADDIEAICRRAFGPDTKVAAAAELGTGMYNSTYQVTVAGREQAVIVRIAPEPERQFTSERALMRSEYASLPYLAALAPLLPRVLAADFTHEVVGRDYMVQSFLDGVPATEHLRTYPRSLWPVYYRQLGEIARRVHDVHGPTFGPITGPAFGRLSEAVVMSLGDIATDLEGVGLDASDVRKVIMAAHRHQAVLDEITEPRMLAGDLWTVHWQVRCRKILSGSGTDACVTIADNAGRSTA